MRNCKACAAEIGRSCHACNVHLGIAFRAYLPKTDIGFLFSSWIGSYEGSPWAGTIPQHLSTAIHKATIMQLMQRGMKIVMAVNPDDDDQILGFIAYESSGPILHYVFVKSLLRGEGVAKALLAFAGFSPDGPVFHTFRTPDLNKLRRMVHRPGFARRKAPYDPSKDGPLA